VPKIIDEALFSIVRERLAVHIARNPRRKKYDYLLANVMECGCGVKRGGAARKLGKYLYYDCYDKVYCFPLPKRCHDNPINARIADKLVWGRLTELMGSSELLIKHADLAVKALYAEKRISTDTALLEKQIAKFKQQEERYTKAYGTGIFTMEQLQENIAPIREKIASLQLEITKARQQGWRNDYDPTPSGEEINDVAEAYQELLSGDLSFEQKRAIVLRTVEKIVGTQEKLQVSGFIPVTTTYYGGYTTEDRHSWIAERGEVHAF
jgi:site-specific DNA recombinase